MPPGDKSLAWMRQSGDRPDVSSVSAYETDWAG
jgi:hypothetical protein